MLRRTDGNGIAIVTQGNGLTGVVTGPFTINIWSELVPNFRRRVVAIDAGMAGSVAATIVVFGPDRNGTSIRAERNGTSGLVASSFTVNVGSEFTPGVRWRIVGEDANVTRVVSVSVVPESSNGDCLALGTYCNRRSGVVQGCFSIDVRSQLVPILSGDVFNGIDPDDDRKGMGDGSVVLRGRQLVIWAPVFHVQRNMGKSETLGDRCERQRARGVRGRVCYRGIGNQVRIAAGGGDA